MRTAKWIQTLAIVLILFFLLQYLSRLGCLIANSGRKGDSDRICNLAIKVFPFDYYLLAEGGASYLKRGLAKIQPEDITAAVNLLRRSVELNPLYYPARSLLAKAYLAKDYPRSRYFREAVHESKTAAKLRPGNLEIAMDMVKLLLSMWPFLEDDDREICRALLHRNISRLNWSGFQPILDLWWYYNKEIDFLVTLMKENPSLYFEVAERLVQYRLPLDLRRRFLTSYEGFIVEEVTREFSSLTNFMSATQSDLERLLATLHRVKGYGLLVGSKEKHNDWKVARELEKKIRFELIRIIVGRDAKKLTPDERRRVEEVAYSFLDSATVNDHMADLRQILEDSGFFSVDSINVMRIQALFNFKSSGFWEVISRVESFKQSLSFVRREASTDYVNLMIVLCDAYISSRLLSQANELLKELRAVSPENKEIYWRVLQVESIFGPEALEAESLLKGKETVLASRFVHVEKPLVEQKVYISAVPEIEIKLDPTFVNKISNYSLFQIFLDGRIINEFYTDMIPERIFIPSSLIQPLHVYQVTVRLI